MAGGLDPTVFLSSEGCVAVLSGGTRNSGFSLSMSGPTTSLASDTSYDTVKSIITSVTMNEETNTQFNPTLDKAIFIYVFGDKVSSMDVSGVCFLSPQIGGVSGVAALREFYNQNKISASGQPVTATISSAGGAATSFKAFLVAATFSANDPQNMTGSFSLKLNYVP